MRRRCSAFLIIALALWTLPADPVGASERAEPKIVRIRGQLFDESAGNWGDEDIFAPDFVPFNRLDVPVVLFLDIDLGEACRWPSLGEADVAAIAKGERQPPARPKRCNGASGSLDVSMSLGGDHRELQRIALRRFAADDNGFLRIPVLFYRSRLCEPVRFRAKLSTHPRDVTRAVAFTCGE